MRRLIVLVCLASMVWSQYASASSPQDDLAAARSANTYAHGQVNVSGAATTVPGYTATPPQAAYYGQPDLKAAADARRRECALLPDDPVCQAQGAADAVAHGPLQSIAPNDPLVAPASAIARNPFGVSGNLADFYSGCSTAGACTPGVFCLGERCFDITSTNDPDFAQAMTYMEAAREAGVYLDTASMRVFSGEASRCRDRLFTNCCDADRAGAGFTNQSLFGVGSRLVYDVLMNSSNRRFITQGLNALISGAGFSGSFTTYGVTIAASGTAVPAGAVTLYSGQSVVIAFDPYTLIIAIIIYIVMSLMSCSKEEGKLAMKEGAKLCRSIGTWCSKCIRVLGSCVACTEHTTSKCCFNSQLARLINEQGRAQLGMGWGKAQQPQCEGFTVAQLQALDFSRMDLTEFYASIVPTLPNIAAMRATNTTRAASCYYGGGKC